MFNDKKEQKIRFFLFLFIYLFTFEMLWPSGERERAHTSVRLTSAASQDGQRSSE